jgi:hypothetical protein
MSRFHVLHPRTHFRRTRGCRVPFSYFALTDSFSTVPSASSPIFMFCARTHFRWYQGRRVPFSYFALPDSFSAVPSASGSVFMFCAPELIFGGAKSVESCFHILHSRTHFRRYRGCQIQFSCFTRSNSFSAVS